MDKLPAIIKEIIDLIVAKFGGSKAFIIRKLLEYGGQYLVNLYKKLVANKKEVEGQTADEKKIDELSDQLVKDSQKTEGMTDEELIKKQENAWRDFVDKSKL